jgi:hypothetical protein
MQYSYLNHWLEKMSPKIAEAVVGRTMLAPFSNLIGDSWQYKAAL